MKTNATQTEILLVTNNSFAQREWCKKESSNDKFSFQEQMEEMCANGLIYEILPELFTAPANKKFYLWQMRPAFSFLQLEYGEFPIETEKATSLNPHNYLSLVNYN